MKRIVTGITPTGDLTIGNYLGAIKQLISNKDKFEMYIFTANLHALSELSSDYKEPQDKSELLRKSYEIIAMYLACGLEPEKTNIFVQSQIPEHSELAYILICCSTIGQLSRMVQYKEKNCKTKISKNIPTGLLVYPCLMAADILLYQPDLIPVGQDQKQHIELCRDLAMFFNRKFGTTFKMPEPQINKEIFKIYSLTEPTKKMSKSDENPNSFILLLDSKEEIHRKISLAKTDSENKIYFDLENKPGISNLINIYKGFSELSIVEIEKKFCNSDYKKFKQEVSSLLTKKLQDIQEKYAKYFNKQYLDVLLADKKSNIQKEAKVTLDLVKRNLGLL